MGRSVHSSRGSERFVQWNESVTEDIDITNLIGPGSTIFGKKKKHSSSGKSGSAPGSQETGLKARSKVGMGDARTVACFQTPVSMLKTPPPPHLKTPRRPSNSPPSFDTPRGTPSNGAEQTPAEGESQEEDEYNDTPAQPGRGEQPDKNYVVHTMKKPLSVGYCSCHCPLVLPRRNTVRNL